MIYKIESIVCHMKAKMTWFKKIRSLDRIFFFQSGPWKPKNAIEKIVRNKTRP